VKDRKDIKQEGEGGKRCAYKIVEHACKAGEGANCKKKGERERGREREGGKA